MDVLVSEDLWPSECTVEPARARMVFTRHERGSSRPVGTAQIVVAERLGLVSEWLHNYRDGPLDGWLAARACGTGGRPEAAPVSEEDGDDGIRTRLVKKPASNGPALTERTVGVRELERGATVAGHEIVSVLGTRPAPGLARLLGRRNLFEAAAWICPADGRLYYVETSGAPPRAGGAVAGGVACDLPLAGGRLSCCSGLKAEGQRGKRGRRDQPPVTTVPSVPSVAGRGTEGGWVAMLVARPVRNAAAEVREVPCLGEEGAGSLRLSVKKRSLRFLVPPLSWIIRPRETREMVLDGLGSVVWGLCDGERTVEEVVTEFARRYRLTFHEARVAVTGYMKSLVQRGALAMVVPEPERG